MTSADVAKVAVQAAHVDGIKKGVSKVTGVSVFGVALVVVAAVGVVMFMGHHADTDKKNAVYDAESRAFSHGVNTAHEEAARAKAQSSRVVSV